MRAAVMEMMNAMMKYSIWRYILLICLCAAGGGLSSSMAGPVSIFRGAVLGAWLAAAFPAIDYLKSKGKCRSVWTVALTGAGFGLLAGLIMCRTRIVIDYEDAIIPVLNQPLQLILLAALYGFFVHLSLAVNMDPYWKLPVYMGAMFFCHYSKFVLCNQPFLDSLIFALLGFMPFALLWGIPVARLLIVPELDSMDNISKQQGEKVS